MPFDPHDRETIPPPACLTRRAFLARSIVGGAGLALLPSVRAFSNEPAPWFAWFSDIHISANQTATNRGQTMAENLERVVTDILAQPDRPRGVVITGDLALSKGEAGDYRSLQTLLAPLKEAKIPIHLALGNHDNREHFRAVLHVEPPPDPAIADKHVTVVDAPGARFLLLDSNRGNHATNGELGERQLEWLTKALDGQPDRPTILCLHHNPDHGMGDLVDAKDFLAIVKPRKQVKLVVFGHTHNWGHFDLDGLTFLNLPATAYTFATFEPLGWVRYQPTPDGCEVVLHCIGGNRDHDGQRVPLKWRT